jgi:hypothetical protein
VNRTKTWLIAATLAGAALLRATAQQTPAPAKLPPKLSTHALDTYTGKQAAGIRNDARRVLGTTRA